MQQPFLRIPQVGAIDLNRPRGGLCPCLKRAVQGNRPYLRTANSYVLAQNQFATFARAFHGN